MKRKIPLVGFIGVLFCANVFAISIRTIPVSCQACHSISSTVGAGESLTAEDYKANVNSRAKIPDNLKLEHKKVVKRQHNLDLAISDFNQKATAEEK